MVVTVAIILLTSLDPFKDPILVDWDSNLHLELEKNSLRLPPLGWIKINADAAIMKSNNARVAGVIRDHKGKFILAYGKNGHHRDIAGNQAD